MCSSYIHKGASYVYSVYLAYTYMSYMNSTPRFSSKGNQEKITYHILIIINIKITFVYIFIYLAQSLIKLSHLTSALASNKQSIL